MKIKMDFITIHVKNKHAHNGRFLHMVVAQRSFNGTVCRARRDFPGEPLWFDVFTKEGTGDNMLLTSRMERRCTE